MLFKLCVVAATLQAALANFFSPELEARILQAHNDVRTKTYTGEMQCNTPSGKCPGRHWGVKKLVWDEALAKIANDHVEKCRFEHSNQKDMRDAYVAACKELGCPASGGWVGENLHGTTSTTMYTDSDQMYRAVAGQWGAGEARFWRAPVLLQTPDSITGHFTQIVWDKTSRVGCAYKLCASGRNMFMCNYYAAGNLIEEPIYSFAAPTVEPSCVHLFLPQLADGKNVNGAYGRYSGPTTHEKGAVWAIPDRGLYLFEFIGERNLTSLYSLATDANNGSPIARCFPSSLYANPFQGCNNMWIVSKPTFSGFLKNSALNSACGPTSAPTVYKTTGYFETEKDCVTLELKYKTYYGDDLSGPYDLYTGPHNFTYATGKIYKQRGHDIYMVDVKNSFKMFRPGAPSWQYLAYCYYNDIEKCPGNWKTVSRDFSSRTYKSNGLYSKSYKGCVTPNGLPPPPTPATLAPTLRPTTRWNPDADCYTAKNMYGTRHGSQMDGEYVPYSGPSKLTGKKLYIQKKTLFSRDRILVIDPYMYAFYFDAQSTNSQALAKCYGSSSLSCNRWSWVSDEFFTRYYTEGKATVVKGCMTA